FVDSINLEEEPLSVRDALRISRHALEGLIHAHEKGILHRDIKPANILVSRDFKKVKLTDFGLAKAIDESVGGKLTSTGIIMGTPNYLDPERARAEPVVKESDVFSLGATFYKLLTGSPPAQGTSPMDTLGQIGHDKDLTWPRTVKPQISEELEDVVMMMLSKDLRRRLTTYEVRALLDPIERENRFLHQSPSEELDRKLADRRKEVRRRLRKLRRAAKRRGKPDRFVAAGQFYDAMVELAELQPRSSAESVSARADLYTEAIQFHRDGVLAGGPQAPAAVEAKVRLLEKRLALERRRLDQKGFRYVPPRRSRPWLRIALVLLLAVALGVGGFFGYEEWARWRNETALEEASRGLARVEQSLSRREHVKASQEIESVQAVLGGMRRPHTPEFARDADALRARLAAHREAIGRYRTDIQVY
ncbi:MAG: protein kinase domain-containing protein, partial [Candidatus Rokuibacteriota bacterium]